MLWLYTRRIRWRCILSPRWLLNYQTLVVSGICRLIGTLEESHSLEISIYQLRASGALFGGGYRYEQLNNWMGWYISPFLRNKENCRYTKVVGHFIVWNYFQLYYKWDIRFRCSFIKGLCTLLQPIVSMRNVLKIRCFNLGKYSDKIDFEFEKYTLLLRMTKN